MFDGFILLIQFMTRIPINLKIEYDAKKLARSFKLFPFIGVIFGVIEAGVFLSIIYLTDNRVLAAIVTIIADVLLSGGLHLDGLADTFDAIYSYRDKEKMLEIMKDSRLGTNGAIVLIIYFLFKTILMISLTWQYILVIPVIARISPVINAGFGKYARKSGMGQAIADFTNKKDCLISILIASIFAVYFLELNGLIIIFTIIVFSILFLREVTKKIEGVTGDTFGAVVELSVLIALFVGNLLN